MKNLYLFFLVAVAFTNAQTVSISDTNFKARLISTNCADFDNDGVYDGDVDTNNDGEIQNTEASLVLRLNLNNSNIFSPNSISNITGIEAFLNLIELNFQNNLITSFNANIPSLQILELSGCQLNSLDLTGVPNLINLYCNQCGLNSLNLNSTPNLISISCVYNQLNTLSISGLSSLTSLDVRGNGLTSLDLSQNTSVTSLNLGDNPFTPDVSNLINLVGLECSNMGLTTIDLTNNINLTTLSINGNNFTNLTLPNLPLLNTIFCGESETITSLNLNALSGLLTFRIENNPNLLELYLKNGMTEFGNISLSGNSNLQYLCVDDFNVTGLTTFLAFSGLTGVNVSSYCSFTPGGNYNTITGTVTFDANNNGCDDNDIVFPNFRININDGTTAGASFTGENGNYKFYTQTGNFNLTPAIENPSWFNITPSNFSVTFLDTNNNTTTQNICITPVGIHDDVEIVIVPTIPARPGFDATYKIVYKNKGNTVAAMNSGISLTFNDDLMDYLSSTQTVVAQNTGFLAFNVASLLPFESRSFEIVFTINAPTDQIPVNINDVLPFSAIINVSNNDQNITDNSFTLNQIVVGSYDPNDITCLEGDIVSPSEIGNYLHYNIRFENTGTAAAENIVVKTEINPDEFNINTLQLLNASHAVDARIRGNTIEFIFQGIFLETGGHGNVLLKVKTKPSLQTGALVKNKANIYFDYNFPIITNDAVTVFQTLSNPDFEIDKSVKIYPNPTNSLVNISGDFNIKSIQLFDVQGRLLQTTLLNDTNATLDLTPKAKGLYFIKVISEAGIKVEKLIKK